ncbi:MAG: MBL fold metallo-hydrolase [Planctomycetes bacterium]|nr:MBL fold metallo-hydrolase [Planctomycetota bacterium]
MPEQRLHIHITNDLAYMENGYTVYLRDGGPVWIIDPGLSPQGRQILRHIREHNLNPATIVLTHAHPDHIAGIDEVRDALGEIPVYLAREEWPMLSDAMENLSGLMGQPIVADVKNPIDLPHGGSLDLDGTNWKVFDVSGHSPGGRAIYCAELGIAFVGDALFAGGVGRTDFPHSNGPKLFRNIRANLMTLPDATRVLSGHGPETTIGHERRTNPFLV